VVDSLSQFIPLDRSIAKATFARSLNFVHCRSLDVMSRFSRAQVSVTAGGSKHLMNKVGLTENDLTLRLYSGPDYPVGVVTSQ